MLDQSLSSQLLVQNQKLYKHQVSKNRLLLISLINVITFFCAIFSMSFYEWIFISAKIQNDIGLPLEMWINLLYVSIQNQPYIGYIQAQQTLCWADDSFCYALFYELRFIGGLSFGIFIMGLLLQFYDFILILKYFKSELKTKDVKFNQKASAANFKNNFRNALMILTYLIGITLNYFGMSLIKLQYYRYGVSFWLFFASLIILGIITIWENRSMAKIYKQELVIKLIEGEKGILKAQQKQEEQENNNRSSIFSI